MLQPERQIKVNFLDHELKILIKVYTQKHDNLIAQDIKCMYCQNICESDFQVMIQTIQGNFTDLLINIKQYSHEAAYKK